MRKSLLPVAAILGWSVALAAVSSLEAMDPEQEQPVIAAQTPAQEAERKLDASEAELETEQAALKQ